MCFLPNVPGFRSYVGKVISVLRSEKMMDLEYEECGTDGLEVPSRFCFSPSMFYNIAPVNKYQREKLLSSHVHTSFNAFAHETHKVKFLFLFSFLCIT